MLSADTNTNKYYGLDGYDSHDGYDGHDGNDGYADDEDLMLVMKGCCRTEAADTNAGCLDPVA